MWYIRHYIPSRRDLRYPRCERWTWRFCRFSKAIWVITMSTLFKSPRSLIKPDLDTWHRTVVGHIWPHFCHHLVGLYGNSAANVGIFLTIFHHCNLHFEQKPLRVPMGTPFSHPSMNQLSVGNWGMVNKGAPSLRHSDILIWGPCTSSDIDTKPLSSLVEGGQRLLSRATQSAKLLNIHVTYVHCLRQLETWHQGQVVSCLTKVERVASRANWCKL